jgi:hypothetical protein
VKVEVELEDLETTIFAAAAIKTIEEVLNRRKTDPFVKPHLDYTQAHNNLTAVMNSAKRDKSGYRTNWNGELTDEEFKLLKLLGTIAVDEIPPGYRLSVPSYDTLLAKGCIRMGQCVVGAVWAGEQQPDIKPTEMFAVAITQRGRDKLQEILMKKAEDLFAYGDSGNAGG